MNCQKCGQDVVMPFHCPYCGGQFCSQHRLPENHDCPHIGVAQTQRQETVADSFAPTKHSYEFSISFGHSGPRKGHVYLGVVELKHLLLATLLVIGIGFSIAWYAGYVDYFGWGWTLTSVYALLLTASFLTHEMAHKIVAQRAGLWSEFRLTTWGAVLTLVSIVLPFKLIAPGAVMISGPARLNQVGKISIVGPITNIVFSMAFLGASFAFNPATQLPVWWLLLMLSTFNSIIAIFNLIPFGILDGYKIFSWNKMVWAAAFVCAIALALPAFLLTMPYYGF